ncbi:vegetative incompatibility protein HET-E-1 [Boeremia exigua]|uniref:vegetative incompatibility protein HET-E-1 n=1 Tax=Boeremia exigua TaxID=749465 RepID=UPI001E8D96B5|nr:vegetative incompatibility protein HET-E-1 [Boeremia exigua]KAH6642109.1 vegetative incompatibility protein HET-E-1 [Boeremia exigua]
MRLLHYDGHGELGIVSFDDRAIPPYAILSHTWEADAEEVTFADLVTGDSKAKRGYKKIRFCGQQAQRDGLQYFWVDTCCIDKTDKAELSYAIRSMFRWYQNATRCYVYLSDVSAEERKPGDKLGKFTWEPAFRLSRWFTRGWTLQELLAPTTVEFFSQEWEMLGDKISLKLLIYKITSISLDALNGAPLSLFSVDERLRWKGDRETKREEDVWYSLSGIFDVEIAPAYSEGAASAFRRLMDEIDRCKTCVQGIRSTDPRDDKKRIEETKGGLLADSYHWVLDNATYQEWQHDERNQLLWVKGDPGKGKTMLLCGIIDRLHSSLPKTALLAYFFCQATDSRINSATAVLRGLLYMLVSQQPSLVSHVRKKHDHTGKALFEDANAWVALTEIFTDVLRDPQLRATYLIIDALDECVTDRPKLLHFVAKQSSASQRVKWIMSSRNWPEIEEQLEQAGHKVRLSLELNAESVSAAVGAFIQHKVSQLAKQKKYDRQTQDTVLERLTASADGTFLWVALVCQELQATARRNVLKKLDTFPPGLNALYERMMQQISVSDDAELCKQVLALAALVYRPITLEELVALAEPLEDMADEAEVREIISLCGSFLSLREDTVYFVHQSAQDYLFAQAYDEIFPHVAKNAHHVIFLRSLAILSRTLQKDIYSLEALGFAIEDVRPPKPDPLAALRYPCVYWIDHLYDSKPESWADSSGNLQVTSAINKFIRRKYLYWLEGLSLCRSIGKGVVSIAKLCSLVKEMRDANELTKLVQDAHRFIMYHKGPIESFPLQLYSSALLFSPSGSAIRKLFRHEEPKEITVKPAMSSSWSACLQTLEGHSDAVTSVAFSHDSTKLASASHDNTVKVWDASSGACLQTLEGHSSAVTSVAFSHDSTKLASASDDKTVKVWDASSGACLQTLKGHSSGVTSVAFSHDSTKLASASWDNTVKVWDASSGACLQTLEGHSSAVTSVAFSHDSTKLASASYDKTVKVWDASSGACLQTLEGHSDWVTSVAFSHDSTKLASASYDKTVKVWDASSGACLQTLKGHSDAVTSVAFSHDSTKLASASWDNTVKVWDASSGACLQTLEGHSSAVTSVAFSHDSTKLASASYDKTVKVWDASSGACLQTLKGHSDAVTSVAFSHDSTKLASASHDNTVKVWDASSGACLQTLEGHSSGVTSVAFSHDLTKLASASDDKTVKVWDASSGACLQTLKGHSSGVTSVAFSHDSTKLASASYDKTVKVWDASSGACLQTINIGRTLHSISFDSTSSSLHTEIGHIAIHSSGTSSEVAVVEPECPLYSGTSLSSDSIWVKHDDRKVLWIPSEYRPSCSAVCGSTVGMGVGSGRVWSCSIDLHTHICSQESIGIV